MKYWNKNSDIRKKCWHKVSLNSKHKENDLKRIFQLYPSRGKFHISDLSTLDSKTFVYTKMLVAEFELEQDAIIMSLRYGG